MSETVNPSDSPLAMQIIVKDTKDFTELELCLAVGRAVASNTARNRLSKELTPAYTQWSLGEHRKVVRRARGALWDKLLTESNDGIYYSYPDSPVEIIIRPPAPIADISKLVKKAQVSGLATLPAVRSYATNKKPLLAIYSNSEVEMSAGKRASAVAHIAQLMTQKLTDEDFELWRDREYQLRVSSLGYMEANVRLSSVFVADNGHTEVTPGTVTAMGVWGEAPPLHSETLSH